MGATQQQLPTKALAWIALVVLLGTLGLGTTVASWESPDLIKFAGFLIAALFTLGTELAIPGPVGNLPLTFVFVLMATLDLSSSETVALAVIVALGHCFWHPPQKPQPLQVAFNVGTAALAASAAVALYDSAGIAGTVPVAGRFALATAAFCVLHTAPVAGAVALSEELPFFRTWRECYLWTLPYYLGGGVAAFLFSVASHLIGWQTVLLSGPLIYLVYRVYRLHVSRFQNEKQHAEDVSALHLRTIQALALAIEAKDHTTHDHLARVQVYAKELARELKLSASDQQALLAASLLHDIGKLAVPEHIISKPGRLSPEEFEKMKIHPTVGAEILERVQFPYPVVPIVRAHHERWDGGGYPAGLKGEDIPIGARILAAVDCLDALASDRQYRRALPVEEAMKVVENDSGKAFDPRVVEVLKRRYVELEQMAKAEGAGGSPLSTEVKVERGDAPGAGFESHAAAAPAGKDGAAVDFIGKIAAARQEVQTLFEISQELGSSLSVEDTMSMLAMRLRPLVPHHSMAIWVRRDNVLTPAFVLGDDFRLFSSLEIPMGQGLSGWVAENLKPIVNGNPSVESGYLADPKKFSTLRSAIAVPLEGMNGATGVLALYHADRDAFSREHLRLLLAIAGKIGISIENALRFRQAESSATVDFLTGLTNGRALFVQLDRELSRARRENLPVTAVVLDLNGFKKINDRFGHLEGDRVLRGFAAGLKSTCREYDTVARMGGDEFAVVLPGARPEDIINRVAQFHNVLAGICRDRFGGELLTVSTGTASFPPDGSDAEAILAQADRRMYAEKSNHRGQTLVPSMAGASEWGGLRTVQ